MGKLLDAVVVAVAVVGDTVALLLSSSCHLCFTIVATAATFDAVVAAVVADGQQPHIKKLCCYCCRLLLSYWLSVYF